MSVQLSTVAEEIDRIEDMVQPRPIGSGKVGQSPSDPQRAICSALAQLPAHHQTFQGGHAVSIWGEIVAQNRAGDRRIKKVPFPTEFTRNPRPPLQCSIAGSTDSLGNDAARLGAR